MKKKTFIKTFEYLKEMIDDNYRKCDVLSEAFGGDSRVYLDETGVYVENLIKIIAYDFVTEDITYEKALESLDWLFWESMSNLNSMEFFIDGKKYYGTPENIWKELKGKI